MSRRNLLKGAGAAVIAAAAPSAMASGIGRDRSAAERPKLGDLLRRGEPEIYVGEELNFIGMPIGGLFSGTVYLGGDGQLWNWDIFNQEQFGCVQRPNVVFMDDTLNAGSGANYVDPVHQQSPFSQRFFITLEGDHARPIRFGTIRFRGEYPVAKVEFSQADADVEAALEAFSPFCPLDVDSSSHPATTLTFTLKNIGKAPLAVQIGYEADNPVLLYSKGTRDDFDLLGQKTESSGFQFSCRKKPTSGSLRPDVLFEDWSSGTYGNWTATGDAFGEAPRKVSELPSYMGDVKAGGAYVVNSHQTRNGEDVAGGDAHTGTLTSPSFAVERKYIDMRIGGGNHAGRTCVNLLVDGKVARSVTGHANNAMGWESFPVSDLEGKQAQIQVVDREAGAWGNISLGEVIFSDLPRNLASLEKVPDFGTFCAEIVGGADVSADASHARVSRSVSVAPGQSKEVTLIVAWHFPNCAQSLPGKRHWYASKWADAHAVASGIAADWPRLQKTTRDWNRTWYDSTLPYWFLDRTFVNTSILATSTCHRLDEGRFYFWEGTGCCAGTCTHVWGYAQAIGRVFPEVERYLRKEIDFGRFYHADTGAIDYRGEFGQAVAVDGQASCILRAYREHQMCADPDFLRSIWPQVKGAMKYLIQRDAGRDGILDGAQYNTLDTAWYGEISWISSLYIAALRAAEAMANEMDDPAFAAECATLAEKGSAKLVADLFSGEYFINRADESHPEANNTRLGCHIDQLYGQSWALQVGLPRVVPAGKAVAALKSLYKYNFYDDVWEYRRKNHAIPNGRWYAEPGEAGLIMCSFPKGGAELAAGKGSDAWAMGYLNECMSGFEYQAAAHMIAEGLVEQGMNVVYAIHRRYHPSKRNPYNEIECSDHYGRSMASYGAFVALCGFHVDGIRHKMSFVPRLGSGAFRCPFVNEQGWGVYRRSASGAEDIDYRYRI